MVRAKRAIQKVAGVAASPAWISRLAKKVKALLAKEREENRRIAARTTQTVKGLRQAREKARAESRRLK